jgi:hypothetical protein
MPKSLREDNGASKGGISDLFISLIWLVWLISSLYLIAMSAYYAFLSVVFTGYSIRAHVRPSQKTRTFTPDTGQTHWWLLCSEFSEALQNSVFVSPRFLNFCACWESPLRVDSSHSAAA